jgi:hypothetical protein
VDGGGTRDEVEKLSRLGVKRGSFDRVHGDKCYVVEDVDFNSLDKNAVQGGVDVVPDGGGGGGKLGSISLNDKLSFAEGETLLGRGGLSGGGRGGRRGGLS